MDVTSGTQFARLLLQAFDVMVAEVRSSLEEAGYPGLTVANELAMQAIQHGASTAAALARVTGVSRQAAAKTIDTLETLGYVSRKADPIDARSKQLHVTPEGRNAVRVGAVAFDRIFDRWQKQNRAGAGATVAALEALIASSPSDGAAIRATL
jgi:DNA-binding MarR family transcriptional regulator